MDININSVYPNGLEKRVPLSTSNHYLGEDVKQRALSMLCDGKTVDFVSNKLNINRNTIATWKTADIKERY